MKHLFYLPFLISISCSQQEMTLIGQENAEETSADSMYPALRVDIYPVSDNENLLPQSFSVDPESEDLDMLRFDLADTVELSGYVHGTTIYPHSDGVSVPSSRAAIESQIQLSIPNSLNGSIVNTDEEGWFSLMVPANDQYQFSITPISPTDLPFTITDDFFLRESQDLEIELEMGIPIFGSVMGIDELLAEATLQIIDRETEIRGPKNIISEHGSFVLRAPSERPNLILRLEGLPNSAIPTIDIPFSNEQIEGQEINIDVGDISPVTLSGTLKTSSGVPFVDRASILFTSKELSSSIGQLAVETSNDGNGLFSVKLLPGSWIAQFIPPYDDSANSAPISIEFEIEENTNNVTLPDVFLNDDIRIYTRILDSTGQPAPNVLVSFQETDFDEEIYTGFTDSEGRLDIRIPSGTLNVTLTPTNSVEAITKVSISDIQEGEELQWTLEKGRSIGGSVYHRNVPVAHALIEVWENGTLLTSRFLNEAGAFEIKLQVD
jgi:hypothetical protein